jgi:F-type H+-transporting ATPase subunit delta
MTSRGSAARYAKALFDVARQESTPEQIERELESFADLLQHSPELEGVLTNPVVPVPGKRGVMQALLPGLELSTPVSKLLLLLVERGRIALVPELLEVYRERLMEHQRVLRAEVTTATALSDERVRRLAERLSTATGRRVLVDTRVDPALIAGIVARIGSTVYDGSVATQLAGMRQRLVEQI